MRVLKAKVSGKVQGVWFRKYTLNSARDIGAVSYTHLTLPTKA